ncbi:glycosylphosphatidylinositol anchor biosynthesis [Mucor velutinosus]|uniref:Glycosylphosphatidylinositol anchor biosynthesis n=1 Tax=Mucor velutinosus TaxID=708070 RepID=A0AAN7DA35_9FUNG|nr:glycosylphosphatidylinositol anchor biosynthesis [Mucor velutinosus]
MELDTPIHNAKPLPESERKAIIEAYPPKAHLDYKAPNTIPSAERLMNREQKYQDTAIKQLQYLLSAAFRPLDILTNEMFTYESGNPNLERYSVMLRDTRRLLLHVCSIMTQQRTNIALRAHNPAYRLNNTSEVNYTPPLNEFQQTLVQQHAAMKATREATVTRRLLSILAAGWFQQQHQQPQQLQQQQCQQQPQQQDQQQQQQFPTKQEKQQPFSSVTATTATPSTIDPVGGRLSKYFQHWTNITKNSFVLNTVQHGYYIPFHTTPPTTTTPTSITPFSAEQATLIDQAIQDLLAKSAIEPVSPQQVQQQPGFYSSMIVIPKKNGGVRPVFNLKRLNQFLEAPHFKMETIKEVSLMIKPNDYLVSIDLSDAFLVCLHPESRRFLRLKWRIQVYQYCTTAFGLSSSPFVFTKVCRSILEHLRSRGFRISTYLDDWLLIANSRQQAEAQTRQVVSLLEDLGWLINYKKSVLTPTQQLEHLGFVLNTRC